MKSFRKKHPGVFRISAAAALLALTGGIYYRWDVVYFRPLEERITRRAERRPVRFFSSPLWVHPGDEFSPSEIRSALSARGYFPSKNSPPEMGAYFQEGHRVLEIFPRFFEYPDDFKGGPFRLTFAGGAVESIVRLPGGEPAEEFRLEPRLISEGNKGGADRSLWIPLDKISDVLKKAVVLSEDRRFFGHHGVDPRGMARALWAAIRRVGVPQGGSTLTQQLVKNALLTSRRTFRRKTKEIFLALSLELRRSKEFILEAYLNQIYLGRSGTHSVFGVEEAARAYFDKSASALRPSEAALLTAIIPSPNSFHPRWSPEKAFQRRNRVLGLMKDNGVISDEEWAEAVKEPIKISPATGESTGLYYLDAARRELEDSFSPEELEGGDFEVCLAMEPDLQRAAEKTLAGQSLEGALVAEDPFTGYVKAIVGGKSFVTSPYNRAVLSHRQPGSVFKPLIYAAALESGKATTATFLEDKPGVWKSGDKMWSPKNYDGKYREKTTVRDALVFSFNVPSVHLLDVVGIPAAIFLAREAGVESELRPVPSLALGTSEVTPLEMTTAYAPFANGGWSVKPRLILWVKDGEGNYLRRPLPETERILSAETAYVMTDILRDVVERGTGRGIRARGVLGSVAGKTGTSDDYSDAWFVGYTPRLLAGVWLGNDSPSSLGKAASDLAVPVWASFVKSLPPSYRNGNFPESVGVVRLEIDPRNGLKARSGCPGKKTEIFIPGTPPLEYCPLHPGGVAGFFKKIFHRREKTE